MNQLRRLAAAAACLLFGLVAAAAVARKTIHRPELICVSRSREAGRKRMKVLFMPASPTVETMPAAEMSAVAIPTWLGV